MGLFLDHMLLHLADPVQLTQVLAPADDVGQTRLRILLDAMYDLPFVVLHQVTDLQVRQIEREHPLFRPWHTRGTWTQTMPGYLRTDVTYDRLDLAEPAWADLVAKIGLTLV